MQGDFYEDDFWALPSSYLIKAISQEAPVWLVAGMVYWQKFRVRIGWRTKPSAATQWDPQSLGWEQGPVPREAKSFWSPWLEQLRDAGFVPIGWLNLKTIGNKQEVNLWLRSKSGDVFGQLNWTCIAGVEEGTLALISYHSEDQELQTLAVSNKMLLGLIPCIMPEHIDASALLTSRLDKLLATHKERIATCDIYHIDGEQLIPHLRRQMAKFIEAMVESGMLRKLDPKEVQYLQSRDFS